MHLQTIPFHSERGCLSYLILNTESKEAALIDPSEEVGTETYLDILAKHEAKLLYLIETHTHADHISATPELKDKTGARIVRHALAPSSAKDVAVSGSETLLLGETPITVLATPGHTNESISLYIDGAVFTGDALLIGGSGRTDFQLGDSGALYESLHSVIGVLPDEITVYPGHDYHGRTSTTLESEKQTNPRYQLSREEFVTTMDAHHPPMPELFEASIAANSK